MISNKLLRKNVKSFFKILLLILVSMHTAFAQDTLCVNTTIQHSILSNELNEKRNYWVSLPFNYTDSLSYPVIYVLDAEWRFDLVRNIAFDLGGHNKIQKSIIVGIPHMEMEFKRGIDLTFTHSKIEYDGEEVDSTWYNSTNSGGAKNFYNYFVKELMPDVNRNYASNGHETLIGHSFGAYFVGYLLSDEHPFEVLHLYDPSVWYSNGEIISRLKSKTLNAKSVKIHITYQSEPAFHKQKVEEYILELEKHKGFKVTKHHYLNETHNSLFLDSFYRGIQLTNK
jgi:uncharacterized protein